jgi:DNA-binding CsgD family transcriptional regulator
MERLTKKELRTLLECIKECYTIGDLDSFPQRVLSRLAKIVSTEIFLKNGVIPPKSRHTCATYPARACSPCENKILEQRVNQRRALIRAGKAHDTRGLKITDFPMAHQPSFAGHTKQLLTAVSVKHWIAPPIMKQIALSKHNSAIRDQFLIKLLSPHLMQAYRNAATVSRLQQKASLIDQALDRLHLGLIVVSADGKVGLATTCAIEQVGNYLGHHSLRGNCLPKVLCKWVRKQEVGLRGEDDILLRRNPLVLQREGKRLVIRFVSDPGQSLLLLEEQSVTTQPQPPGPSGLSPREAQVLNWLSQGKTNKEIALILELSARTVQKHLEHIYQKMGVENRTGAAAKTYASLATKQSFS